jgi:hypothetical protein
MAFDAPLTSAAPTAATLAPGQQQIVEGQPWTVASVTVARLIAAQGELPSPPVTDRGFVVVDLRSTRGEVGTLDYGNAAAPTWSIGRSVAISELAMTGLADIAEKTLKARGVGCPSCGASVDIKLDTTQSVVCQQCHAVIDVSKGVGGDLAHYAQDNGMEPQIPLGRTGAIALGKRGALPWQVVGYVERCEVPQSDDDEREFWREYLLYHRTEGFAFLVDANDGWSWTAPITGVPQRAGDGVKYEGDVYRKLYDYTGEVTYVLGEFYWRLERNERTFNTDYIGTGKASDKRLNREQTGSGDTQEIVWSAGERLAADDVVKAFNLAPEQRAALQRDASPTAFTPGALAKVFFWVFVLAVVLILFRCSDRDRSDCDALRDTYGDASLEYRNCLSNSRGSGRTGGGSFGGFSSGGGHK